MNDALLVVLCGLISGLTTALGCVAICKIFDFVEDSRKSRKGKNEK